MKTCISKKTAQIFNRFSAFNIRMNEEHLSWESNVWFLGEKSVFGETILTFYDFSKSLSLPLDIQIYRKRTIFVKKKNDS